MCHAYTYRGVNKITILPLLHLQSFSCFFPPTVGDGEDFPSSVCRGWPFREIWPTSPSTAGLLAGNWGLKSQFGSRLSFVRRQQSSQSGPLCCRSSYRRDRCAMADQFPPVHSVFAAGIVAGNVLKFSGHLAGVEDDRADVLGSVLTRLGHRLPDPFYTTRPRFCPISAGFTSLCPIFNDLRYISWYLTILNMHIIELTCLWHVRIILIRCVFYHIYWIFIEIIKWSQR